MKKNKNSLKSISVLLMIVICRFSTPSYACTIVSGIDCKGQVWNANNEDGPFGVSNFINVFPKSGNAKYGYYTLCYISPMFGNSGKIQGGMNEVGLTFDFAAIEAVNKSELKGKKPFPQGDDAILSYILANLSSTEEVVDFFETYWFENGLLSAQMHVADKNGVFATISPSGIEVVEKGQSLITTNFDTCGKEDSASCWRYPVAQSLLAESGANLSTMMTLTKQTAQKTGGTMYSNIQNLSTGDIWLSSKHDSYIIIQTNIDDLLAKGQKSYTFSNLRSILSESKPEAWEEPNQIDLEETITNQYAGTYKNWYIGEIEVAPHPEGIHVSSQFAPSEVLYPISENRFYIPDAQIEMEFVLGEQENKNTLHFYENGNWSFSAWSEFDQ